MARVHCLLLATTAVAVATASCAQPRTVQAPPESPPWFEQRGRGAEAANRDYPTLADIPTYRPETTSYEAWRKGLDTMAGVREALLNDRNIEDVDAAAPAADAFAEQSRAEAERDLERQAVE